MPRRHPRRFVRVATLSARVATLSAVLVLAGCPSGPADDDATCPPVGDDDVGDDDATPDDDDATPPDDDDLGDDDSGAGDDDSGGGDDDDLTPGDDDTDPDDDDSAGPANQPPGATGVQATTTFPVDTEPIHCQIDVPATDPDGDVVWYRFWWDKDGVDAGLVTNTVGPDLTSPGDAWTCHVIPFDGQAEGPETTSTSYVELGNVPPGAPGVAIFPAEPADGDDLDCVVTTPSFDAEGDPVTYEFAWLVDGVPFAYTGSNLVASLTSPGQEWTCEVTAEDPYNTGGTGSAAVTIGGP